MSESYENSSDARYGSSQNPPLPTHGYDLLNSLVSPRLTTQLSSDTTWQGMQEWEGPMPGTFGPGMQFPGQMQASSQLGFVQDMQQEDYIALGEDEDSYEPGFNPAVPRQQTGTIAPREKNKAPPVDSQKKAAELRAKLLANRPQSAASGRSNTPNRSKDLPIQTKSKSQKLSHNEKSIRSNGTNVLSTTMKSPRTVAPTANIQGQHSNQDGMSADIENLLAEGRDAADSKRQSPLATKTEKVSMTPAPMATNSPFFTQPAASEEKRQTLDVTASSSDEEGEIRGDSTQPTSIDQPLKSVESRQDTTTEAQEKLDRQKETKFVYGALKEDKAKRTIPSSQQSTPKAAASKEELVSPKTIEETRTKPLSPKVTRDYPHNTWGRAAAYDSYKPGRDGRRELEMETGRDPPHRNSDHERRTSGTQFPTKESARPIKDQLAAKEKELAELKHATQAARDLFQRPSLRGGAEPVEAMLVNDLDLVDWLDMTEYHDQDYRQRKLSRFRKKRELDAARAELEREDQMELEERSHRAQTTVSPPNNAFSPTALRRASIAAIAHTQMPPPPLPSQPRRESNGDGTSDVPPQASTLTLKRQHAETDTDARPIEKFARTDPNGNRTRGSSPATSVKGEPLSARFPPPAEDRIFRDDDFFDRRRCPPRRSPSPSYAYRPDSRDRRRSYSPRARGGANSGPPARERSFHRVCFNCNQPDHQQRDCPQPRRDGRDAKVGFVVSSNYKGKNPRPFVEKKN